MGEPRSKRNYRIDPAFVPREPTGADFFSFCELDEYNYAKVKETFDKMREHGAQSFRVTEVSPEHPNEPYPHGYWFEGWKDRLANQLPFGAARPDDGTVSPPLTTNKEGTSA